jgi:hypothetical protein
MVDQGPEILYDDGGEEAQFGWFESMAGAFSVGFQCFFIDSIQKQFNTKVRRWVRTIERQRKRRRKRRCMVSMRFNLGRDRRQRHNLVNVDIMGDDDGSGEVKTIVWQR